MYYDSRQRYLADYGVVSRNIRRDLLTSRRRWQNQQVERSPPVIGGGAGAAEAAVRLAGVEQHALDWSVVGVPPPLMIARTGNYQPTLFTTCM